MLAVHYELKHRTSSEDKGSFAVNGNECIFDGANGVRFEVYKNWLEVTKDGQRVGSIESGALGIHGNVVNMLDIDDHKLFHVHFYTDNGSRGMIGACGYGYKGEEWVGFTRQADLEHFLADGFEDEYVRILMHAVEGKDVNQAKEKYGFTVAELLGK